MIDERTLPELDIDDAKRVLATSIGRDLEGIAEDVQRSIERLDKIRRKAGFVNGLGPVAATCKRELEETARKIRDEIADVKRALQEKPEPVASVDQAKADEVREQRKAS